MTTATSTLRAAWKLAQATRPRVRSLRVGLELFNRYVDEVDGLVAPRVMGRRPTKLTFNGLPLVLDVSLGYHVVLHEEEAEDV